VCNRPFEKPDYIDKVQKLDMKKLKAPKDLNKVLLQLLSSPNIANKRWVYEQYDHMVQTNTVVLPGAADAAVLRIKGTGKAISLTTDGNGRFCYLDPFVGGMIAVCEAARNVVCTGAEPVALTNCLNFGNPEKPDVMWQFKEVVEGMVDACKALNVPVISGNVSFYNENNGVAVYPTPVIGMLGIIEAKTENEIKYSTMDFKDKGDIIILLGENKDELGGSEYLKVVHKIVAGVPPELNISIEKSIQQTCLEAIRLGLVKSSHDISEGGLAVALSECCVAGKTGAMLSMMNELPPVPLLFSETQSRIIITIAPESLFLFEKLTTKHRASMEVIGKVGGSSLMIRKGNKTLIDLPVQKLSEMYYNSIQNAMEVR
jgi:phosphoribosylformylglycinamidine synthase